MANLRTLSVRFCALFGRKPTGRRLLSAHGTLAAPNAELLFSLFAVLNKQNKLSRIRAHVLHLEPRMGLNWASN